MLLMPKFGHVGVAVATGVSGWVGAGVLGFIIARRIGFSLDEGARHRLPRIAVAALAMGIGIAFMQMALAPWLAGESTLARIVALGALICTGLAIYAALLHVLGVAQLRDLMTALRRPA